jgi:hypothetical protein
MTRPPASRLYTYRFDDRPVFPGTSLAAGGARTGSYSAAMLGT